MRRLTRPRPAARPGGRRALLALAAALVLAACQDEASIPMQAAGGDARKGARLIVQKGCGGCHVIPGIKDASGVVGPPLTAFGHRIFVAGMLRNTPAGLTTWLKDPQAVVPGNAMPATGLTDEEARDVATYLYTLR